MSTTPTSADDEMREEYDFTPEQLREAERGRYAGSWAEGVNVVKLDADVAAEFPDSTSVNQALRALLTVIRAHARNEAA
jgi:hypothetical protein